MKIAIAHEDRNGSIPQHFEETQDFRIYVIEGGKRIYSSIHTPSIEGRKNLVGFLKDNDFDVLICDGISEKTQDALKKAGITLYAGVTGNAEEAYKAFIDGRLTFNTNHNEQDSGGVTMSSCNHDCEHCGTSCGERTAESLMFAPNPGVKNVIGVVSGKGGVGKSLVTGLLACAMNAKGYKTAILDADITGPSIPKMFGIKDGVLSDGHMIQPAVSKNGTKMISMNLCLPDETQPVVWRGPVLGGVLQQFWEEVDWGRTDFMFVDMPPGTGDVPLTVFQSLPLKGIVIVTTPQELVGMIVAKALNMAKIMNIPVLGIVENMSYFECPDCGKKHYIFGESELEIVASENGINATAQMPMMPGLSGLCDSGKIEESDAVKYLGNVVSALEKI